MSDDSARDDACREYESSLEDLTFNSKPHINMLTILAEENIKFAKDIVAIIEAQITKAPPAQKLPVLYLVDSIVKNVGGDYLEVFAKSLVNSFICVFEKVDEGIKKSLFKLRSTWDEIFPVKKLYALDVRVNSLDPAWPIKPLPPNVNSSIHVNPKFLKPTEEPPPKPVVVQPPIQNEQMIRQQLLAKQKQLLELQQKKIELELEQTKAQLTASNAVAANHTRVHSHFEGSSNTHVTPQLPSKPWTTTPEKLPIRDPRLRDRSCVQPIPPKEQIMHKKESVVPSLQNASERRGQPFERGKPFERMRIPKKENTASEEKAKSKSLSPSGKGISGTRPRATEAPKTAEVNKKDPRMQKPNDKPDTRDEEAREKKRSADKKERDDALKSNDHHKFSTSRGKMVNGSLNKHDKLDTFHKPDIKVNKSNVRKRSRSRSRSPQAHSPKRKERRSPPKRKTRSISPKSGKARPVKHPHNEDPFSQTSLRDERNSKKSISEQRRLKRPMEERPADQRVGQQRILPADHKDIKDGKRWRSGWEENKRPKLPEAELLHGRPGQQRHKPWANQRPSTPRTPKQLRLSIDSNIHIPEALNSANKRDLLRKVSKRRDDGEISNEEFLGVAHQIRQLFQYQEERQRSDSWDESSIDGVSPRKKKEPIFDAYLEHKSKLKRTQLLRPGLQGDHSPLREDLLHLHPHLGGQCSEKARDPLRHVSDRTGMFRGSPPLGMISLDGKSTGQVFEQALSPIEIDTSHDGEISPRFESPNSVHSGTGPDDGPISLDGPPRHDLFLEPGRSGLKLDGSPNHTPTQTSEGTTTLHHDGPNLRFDRFKNSQAPFDGPSSHTREPRLDGPSRQYHSSRFEGNAAGFDGTGGHGAPRYPGHRFDGPHRFERFPKSLDRPVRFSPQVHPRPMRYEPRNMARFEPQAPSRFDHPAPQGRFANPHRFEGSHMTQGPSGYDESRFHERPFDGEQGAARFENQSGGMRFDNPVQPESISFDAAPAMQRFDTQGPVGYCGPNQMRQQEQAIYDPSQGINMQPSNFNLPPLNSFSGVAQPFPMQQNSQAPNFGVSGPSSSDFQGSFRQFSGLGGLSNMIGNSSYIPSNQMPFGACPQFQQPELESLSQIDVNDLLSKLLSTGIIKSSQTDSSADINSCQSQSVPEEEEEEEEEDDDVPDFTGFVLDDMKQRHESIITKLYTGIQCYSCGMRFKSSQTDVYADHLDWHYRQNRSEKDVSKKVTHRRWYYSLTDWIEFEEIADLEERAKSQFFEKVHEEVVQKTQEAAKEREFQSVKAAADVVDELCEICQEQFEMYWEEEEEEWHLKNAIRVDEKTYHPSCYEDYKNTSSFVDCTPSPNKTLMENPLSAFLKQDEADETSCSSVKEEPAEEVKEEPVVKQEEVDVKLERESQSCAIIF